MDNLDYSKQELSEILAMVADLNDLDFQSEVNNDSPEWQDKLDFVFENDIAFPLSKLIILGFVDFDTLPTKSLVEISDTWSSAIKNGFFSQAWE